MTTVQKKDGKDEERTASSSTGSEVDSDVSSTAGSKKKVSREEGPLLLKRGATGTVDFFSRRNSKSLSCDKLFSGFFNGVLSFRLRLHHRGGE